MDLINYFSENHAGLLFSLAGIAFVVELTVLGLSGLVLFFAIGCFITGILTYMGLLGGWEAETFSVGVLSVIAAVVLWKPLKRFQAKEIPTDTSSDLIGREVVCKEDVTSLAGVVRYSGIDWQARLIHTSEVSTVSKGSQCRIVKVDGTLLIVEALSI